MSFCRMVWFLLMVTFIGITSYQIYVVRFYNHPIATNWEMQYPGKLPFPAVMLCNTNTQR